MIKHIRTKRIICLALIVIWMIIVFMFSRENGQESGNTSKNVTIKIVDIITSYKEITENEKMEIVEKTHPVIRKLAHFTLYTIGGILIINYTDKLDLNQRKKIIYAITIGGLYATSDEIHQYFVPSRAMQIKDICIDTAGVITGTAIYILLKSILNRILNLINKTV